MKPPSPPDQETTIDPQVSDPQTITDPQTRSSSKTLTDTQTAIDPQTEFDPQTLADPHTLPLRPKPSPRPTPIKVLGGYEVEGELGRGGMGVVYLARQVELKRRVALKMLTGHYGPEELRRFREEAETAGGLTHTNIAHIYEVGDHDGVPFFSMEYVDGGSLADKLRRDLPTPEDAARLLISVARALHFAHQHGVVHRDMKPANILLDPDGVPKIADFGIAKRLNDDSKLTRTGAVIGTPTYMAPEQAKGNSRHVGPAADVYALGAILYEMLAGRPPFLPEDSETAVTIRVLTEDPVSPAWHRPEIPRDLETICMKCLEKEPRARYASAAAFAEDLRRFLDDESILAKPPNSVVQTIKWVRRHPWKFLTAAAGAVALVVGLTLLTRWELYQRPHLEYATRLDWVNGGLEPIENIGLDKASRSSAYLRLTRRGRFGPITKLESLNARGYPAVLRVTANSDMFPIYTEGLMGAQPNTEKSPESTTLEFSFDGETVREAISRDRNGQVNWRIIYDPIASSGGIARARFVNVQGFATATGNSAAQMEFERDKNGRDMKVRFLNSIGKATTNGEGVYGYKLDRDDRGRIVQIVNLGADEKPAANRIGQTAVAIIGDDVRYEFRDGSAQPAPWHGAAAIVFEYDEAHNPIRVSNLAPDGQPVRDDAATWSLQEMKRNEHGELIQSTIYKADASGSLKQIVQTNTIYNDFGYPTDMKAEGATSWRKALQYDNHGNVTEEKYLDSNGAPIVGERGYAIKRQSYTSDTQGLRVEETYFDPAGNKTYCKAGYHRLITEFDVTGLLRRQALAEHDPSQYKYYQYVSEPEYDAQGHLRRSVARYEDAQGNLAMDSDLAVVAAEAIYDENGRVIEEWRTARDPKTAFGGPLFHIVTEWNSNGKPSRRLRQVCDATRQPLPTVASGSFASAEETFDWNGQRQRIFETGFDEKMVGFSTRETKFFGGALQSVSHRRGDLSIVSSVRVLIVEIVPLREQPKAAELKVGDQLVSANGKPITSAYGFALAEFPGGWIEVIRGGQRLRIDGLVAGELGASLEDRATPGI